MSNKELAKNLTRDNNGLLIYGYCRHIQLLLKESNTIPDEIIILCLRFYPKVQILKWSKTYKGSGIGLVDDEKCAIGPSGWDHQYMWHRIMEECPQEFVYFESKLAYIQI